MKGEKSEVPHMYLGALIHKVETADETESWMISVEKYVKATI